MVKERKATTKKLEKVMMSQERSRARMAVALVAAAPRSGEAFDGGSLEELHALMKRLKEENARLERALPPPGETRYQLEKANRSALITSAAHASHSDWQRRTHHFWRCSYL